MEYRPHDVAAGGISQRVEQPIDSIGIVSLGGSMTYNGSRTYNHLVVCYDRRVEFDKSSHRISSLSSSP